MKHKRGIRTGIFSGSFNPIHIGHLALANYLCEYDALDEVWFLVTPRNPLKEESGLWDDSFRLKLVELSIKGYPKFYASDFEFHLPRPLYTINTLNALKEAHPEREFFLIIGADNWNIFHQWHKPDDIIKHHHVLIYPRLGYNIDQETLPPHVSLVEAPVIGISSTMIRNALKEGKDIRYFLHPNVDQYIKENPTLQNGQYSD